MLFFIGFLLIFISLLISVMYITMLERKIMSYIQHRKGPNKLGFLGLATPILDSLKLLMKKGFFPLRVKLFTFIGAPFLSLLILCLSWFFFSFFDSSIMWCYKMLMIICVLSLSVYVMYFSGWSSNSKYSLLGSLRGVAQIISMEVCFIFIIFIIFYFYMNFSLNFTCFYSTPLFMLFPSLFFVWIVLIVGEVNRAPLDFVEGESELVSGFKIEYGGLGFALLFLEEYGMLLFLSFLTTIIWF